MSTDSAAIEKAISSYFLATIEATNTLYQKKLFGHLLVVIYSTIDTMGLLDAPANQTAATRESFKQWVKKYLPSVPGIDFNEIDLYAARCAVLHTFTTTSALSSAGHAKELQYYSGNKANAKVIQLVALAKSIQGGKHLLVNLEDLTLGLLEAIGKFAPDLDDKCNRDPECRRRLQDILQMHNIGDVF